MAFCEEHDLLKRAISKGEFYYEKRLYVLNNPRRIKSEGLYMLMSKNVIYELYYFLNYVNKEIFNKEYGKF